MFYEPYVIVTILIITMILFIWGKWRYDVVALIALFSAVLFKAVPFHAVYDGLSNPAVITVACVMIMSNMIGQSGLLQGPLRHITNIAHNRFLYVSVLTTTTAILSAFMNNVGALAIMMPVAVQSARKAKLSPAFILMPIALGSAMGGLTTLIGTPPNLLIASYREQALGHAFSMFSFGKVGLIVAIAGVAYVALIGWRLIPKERLKNNKTEELFEIKDYITEAIVTENSPIAGTAISQLNNSDWDECTILGIIRDQKKRMSLNHDIIIQTGDILIIEAGASELQDIIKKMQLELLSDVTISTNELKTEQITLMEAVVSQASRLDGRTPNALRLRSRFNAKIIAVSRQGRVFKTRLDSTKLQVGDVLLLQGEEQNLQDLISRFKLLPLEQNITSTIPTKKAYLGLFFFIAAIIAASLRLAPVQIAFGGAVFLNMLFNVIPVRNYYDNIEWSVIILLAAMIPIGEALQTTGGTTLIAHFVLHSTNHLSPIVTMGLLMIVTMTLSDFMNNAATTVVMAPIAISLAQALQVNIDPFLMAVAISASCSFLTPVGHQNNTIIMGPGGYHFTDYIRVGLLLEIIVLAVSIPMIAWMWPLH